MKVRWCSLIFIVLFIGCDGKSVSSDGTSSCENALTKDQEDVSKIKKKGRLEELKENVGTVGNKLEGIVYEVLKDILKDDIDVSEENDNINLPLNETQHSINSQLINNTVFSNGEMNSSSRLKANLQNSTSNSTNEIEQNPSNPLELHYQLLASNIPKAEFEKQIETTTNNSIHSTSPVISKSRIRRNIHDNTEQSRSVESFMESNQEKSDHFRSDLTRGSSLNPTPQNGLRLRSKDETVRRDPKREPTEDNKSKRPQDDMNINHMVLPKIIRVEDRTESTKKQPSNRGDTENNSLDTPKRRKSPEIHIYPNKNIETVEHHSDYQNQKFQEKKKIIRANNVGLDHGLDRIGKNDFEHLTDMMISRKSNPENFREDFQFPMHREMKENTQKIDKSQRSNHGSTNIPLNTQLEISKINENGRNQESRIINNFNPSEENEDTTLGQSYIWGNQPSNCYEKNNREDMLEKQHIDDLKYEVSKLKNVVDMLKEQQRIINSFDGDKKSMNSQEMLNVLNQINNMKGKPVVLDNTQQYAVDTMTKPKHEELGQIKVQLKEAIDNLNRTKEILNLEHKKEINLETELKTQKTEINWLKLIIENFIISQAKKKLKEENNDSKVKEPEMKPLNDSAIVGAKNPNSLDKKTHNRTIPSTVKMAQEKLKEMERMRERESSLDDVTDREVKRQMKDIKVSSPRSRSSTLEKLLDNLSDRQSKTIDDDDNFQNRLIEAIKQVRRRKEEESFTKDIIRRLQMNTVENKPEDEMLLKFQKALKALDTPQVKSDDLDIEEQLRILQKEINKFKSNDDLNLFSSELKVPEQDNTQLQLLLTKLIASNPQLQGNTVPQLQSNTVPQLTPQQLMQLQKKFVKRPAMVPPVMTNVGTGMDFGINPPASASNNFPPGMGKVGPFYGPFGPWYGSPSNNIYSSNSGYNTGRNIRYFGNNGFNANNPFLDGGNFGANPGPGTSFPGSLGLFSASKVPFNSGIMPGNGNVFSSQFKGNGFPMNQQSSQPLGFPNSGFDDKMDLDKQGFDSSNFFQIAQPNTYGSGPPAPYLPPKSFDAPGSDKVYANQPAYASDKIEELKTEIYALQNAISAYNRPEYIQTTEDKNTIRNLEQQIEELKGIVNSLNGYSGEQQNYPQPVQSQYEPLPYNAANEQKTSENHSTNRERRSKRSIQDETMDNKLNSKNQKQHEEEKDSDGFLDRIVSFLENALHGSHNSTRRKRSIEDNSIDDSSSSTVMDKLTNVLREVLDDESDTQSRSQLGHNTINKMGLTRSAENQNTNNPKQTSLQDIKKQIDHLKMQLGTQKSTSDPTDKLRTADPNKESAHSSLRHALLPDSSYSYNYALNPFSSDLSLKPKKLDIFQEIVAKIMDKVIASLPVILKKLFGFAVHELTAYGDDYGTSYGADASYLSVFRNLGIFGYLPLILLRVVNAVSTFIHILQKNKFLKYFLVPAGIVLLVTGGMVFLIWWMQPGDFYFNYDKLSYDKETQYGGDYYSGDYGKRNGQIVKSYGVDDGKSSLNTYAHPGDPKSLQPAGYPPFYKPTLVDNQVPAYNQ